MNVFHVGRIVLFFMPFLLTNDVRGMNFLEQCFSVICGRARVSSKSMIYAPESKENQTALLPVHNPSDLRPTLYDVLEPMPLELINIIMQYDAYELKGECVFTHEVDSWVNALMELNGETVVFGLQNGVLVLFSLKTGKFLKTIQAHHQEIFELGALLNGCIFTFSKDKTIKYWDMQKKWGCGKEKAVVTDNEVVSAQCMTSIAKDLIDSNSFSGQIRLCDAKTGMLTSKIMIPHEATEALDHSLSDVNYVAMFTPIVAGNSVQCFQYTEGQIVICNDSARKILTTLEAESKNAASQRGDRSRISVHEIQLYDEETKISTASIPIESFRFLIKISKDFWVSDNTQDLHEIRLWHCKTGLCKRPIKMDQSIRAMVPLSNGMLAVGLVDTTIRVVDPKKMLTILVLKHGADIRGLETLKDGRLVSFGSNGFKLWR